MTSRKSRWLRAGLAAATAVGASVWMGWYETRWMVGVAGAIGELIGSSLLPLAVCWFAMRDWWRSERIAAALLAGALIQGVFFVKETVPLIREEEVILSRSAPAFREMVDEMIRDMTSLWEGLLPPAVLNAGDPVVMADAAKRREVLAGVSQARLNLAAFDDGYETLMDDFEANIAALVPGDSTAEAEMRRSMLNGAAKGRVRADHNIERYRGAFLAWLAAVEELMEFLDERSGHFSLSGEHLVFSDDNDLQEFQELAERYDRRLEHVIELEETLAKDSEQTLESSLALLDEF